jgi:hypothetical protein
MDISVFNISKQWCFYLDAGKTFNEETYISIAKKHQLSKPGQTPESH